MFILTADPSFLPLALKELQTAVPQATLSHSHTLAPGVVGITNADFFALAEQWQRQPPIFARHICPVGETAVLTHSQRDITTLERLVKSRFADLVDPTLTLSVQTRIFDTTPIKSFAVNTALADALATMTGVELDVKRPLQILSVIIANQTAHLGLSLAAHNLSDWAGGVRRFAREEGQISRAEFKLLEALEAFHIHLPPRGIALDLGAAPGGWTRVLRQREQYVTAVDPGLLHPSLAQDKSVRHKRMTAEAYLADDPDQFDLIVNDMRMDARDSARLMGQFAPYLYRHGGVIMTLKLPEGGRTAVLDHALNILRQTYTLAAARHLFHNRSEITVYLTK